MIPISPPRRRPRLAPGWLLGKTLLHAALLAPVLWLLWRFKTGALADLADPVNYITHFTGDWALWVLLGALAITPLRRLHRSLGGLARLRRMVGLYAFFYASLHLATYLFLFSGFDVPEAWQSLEKGQPGRFWSLWTAVWPTVLGDLQRRRFVQVGLFSWVILLLLTLTSPQAALRKLGGQRWRMLHRLVYLAATAAVVHFWWLVKAGNRAPWRDTLVLAVLLLARLLPSVASRWSAKQA